MEKVVLGEVTVPSGALVVLDPGYLHDGYWCGNRPPQDPRKKREEADYAVEGPDAENAGKAYNRQWHPLYLFDTAPSVTPERFEKFTKERGLTAHLRRIDPRVTHRARVDIAITRGGGGGELMYNGLWAAAVGGLPCDRKLEVVGVPMEEQEFAGRWRSIDLEVAPRLAVARSDLAGLVMVAYGLLMFADADALGSWQHDSLDGLADFVFHGADATAVASQFGAQTFDDGWFGWRDLPVHEAGRHAKEVQDTIEAQKLRVGVDWRPHSHDHVFMERLRASDEDAATFELAGAELCGFGNRWGDGLFEVFRELDGQGRLVRVRIDAGNEKRKALMRRVRGR